jgi:hypothetical protein
MTQTKEEERWQRTTTAHWIAAGDAETEFHNKASRRLGST